MDAQSHALGLQLVSAAFEGDLSRVRALIAAGANVRMMGRLVSDQEEDYGSDGEGGGGYHSVVASALMWAARKGRLDMVEELLAAGADTHCHVNEISEREQNALIFAASNNHVDIVTRLLRVPGIDVYNSSEALVHAAQNANMDMLLALLAAGASVDYTHQSRTALLWAAEHHDVAMVRALLAAGAHVDAAGSRGGTPLMRAVVTSPEPSVAIALLAAGADVNAQDAGRRTALIISAQTPFVDVTTALLAAGANVNARDAEGRTALLWAAATDAPGTLAELLRMGADANAGRDAADGGTALTHAVSHGSLAMVHALLEKGASVNAAMVNHNTALILAAQQGRADLVRALLEWGERTPEGVRVNEVGALGHTALCEAACGGHLDAVNTLLGFHSRRVRGLASHCTHLDLAHLARKERKAVRFSQALLCASGQGLSFVAGTTTALRCAVFGGSVDVVRALLREGAGHTVNVGAGASLDAGVHLWQCRPISLAADSGRLDMVRELLAVPGIDVADTPALIWAAYRGHVDVVKALLQAPGINVNLIAGNSERFNCIACTALMWAAMKGTPEVARALGQHPGIDVNAVCDPARRYTALIMAASAGHLSTVQELVQLPGIAVNACSSASSGLYTALLWAARINHAGIVDALLAAGAHADVACLVGGARDGRVRSRTALVWAAMHNNLGMARALLAAGARVHPESLPYVQRGLPPFAPSETTALVVAARRSAVEMARELLEAARADPGWCRRQRADGGESGCALHGEPLRLAEERGMPEMVQLLREANQECAVITLDSTALPSAAAAADRDEDENDPGQGNAKRRRYLRGPDGQ